MGNTSSLTSMCSGWCTGEDAGERSVEYELGISHYYERPPARKPGQLVMVTLVLAVVASCGDALALAPAMSGFGARVKRAPARAKQRPPSASSPKAMQERMKAYKAIVARDGKADCCDVYCGAESGAKLWFVGKVASQAPARAAGAVAAQRRFIFAHARNLEPGLQGTQLVLEIATAPRDTEVAVAKGEQAITFFSGSEEAVALEACGFNPEIYEPGEIPFWIRREGSPAPPAPPEQP